MFKRPLPLGGGGTGRGGSHERDTIKGIKEMTWRCVPIAGNAQP